MNLMKKIEIVFIHQANTTQAIFCGFLMLHDSQCMKLKGIDLTKNTLTSLRLPCESVSVTGLKIAVFTIVYPLLYPHVYILRASFGV